MSNMVLRDASASKNQYFVELLIKDFEKYISIQTTIVPNIFTLRFRYQHFIGYQSMVHFVFMLLFNFGAVSGWVLKPKVGE